MSIKAYISKHINKFILLLGLGVFFLSAWQLDELVAPKIDWTYVARREIWGMFNIHIILADASFYNLCWLGIFIGLCLIIGALWFWN